MKFYIKKASGEKELFDIEKFKRSLRRSGSPDNLIIKIAQKIAKTPSIRNTKQIYSFAIKELKKANPAIAARYNLKQALISLGPTGYPFELFIAQIFKAQGFSITLNKIAQGYCVDHELDVVATKKNLYTMIECKFHNRQKYKSDVKIPLYVKARFDDLKKGIKQRKNNNDYHSALVATNTKFTTHARKYGICAGLQLLDWSYPKKNGIAFLIQKYTLYPITTLTTLSMEEKKRIIKNGIILCSALQDNEWVLKKIGLDKRDRNKAIKEATNLCKSNDILNGNHG